MTPEVVLFVITGGALTLYAVLGGADFGAGVWEFLFEFRMSREERRLVDHAMGPIWETNHVWLIFVLVLLFSAFPPAFAALSRALWLPFLFALAGIVFRGTGFAFRHYAQDDEKIQARWGVAFALASTLTPFFLGAAAGAVATGDLAVTADGQYEGDYLTGWISGLSIYTGVFAIGVCAYLAAVYLTRDAAREFTPELAERWRARALGTGLLVGAAAVAGLFVVAYDAPRLWEEFTTRAWPFVGVSLVAGAFSLAALYLRRYTAASLGAVLTVAAVVGGWAYGQYPLIVPPAIDIASAKAADNVLWLFLIAIAVGACLLVPSMLFLFYVFKAAPPEQRR